MRAIDVADKTQPLHRYEDQAVAQPIEGIASMGLHGPDDLHKRMRQAGRT